MVAPGARVGEYEVWGRLGGGGMSDVWLARHAQLAVPVVIKTLRSEMAANPEERVRRMLTEARLMARIPSPFVVRAYDVGTCSGVPYVAQEYVDGLDLDELDDARRDAIGRGLPLWFVCETVAQIAHGLHAGHQHGVLHRDVKPSNLFGSPELGAKLGDFGVAVAKQVGERALAQASGTLGFMPPEALRGEALDRRADVFALGATAFDLRYGRPPFPDPLLLLRAAPHPAFPPPVNPEEAYFQHVLAKMLSPRREDRYRSAAEPRRLLAALAKQAPRPPRPHRDDGAIWLSTTRITAEIGDISRSSADGIVSSANWQLRMRTGVSDALRRAGGDIIEEEALANGEQPLGACIVTGPGRLGCRRVLHAVSAWEQASCVGRATQRALLTAEREKLQTLALPALGTGAARITFEACAAAMAAALRWHLGLGGSGLREVRFVLFDREMHRMFADVLETALFGDDDGGIDLGLPDAGSQAEQDGVSGDAATYVLPATGSRPPRGR